MLEVLSVGGTGATAVVVLVVYSSVHCIAKQGNTETTNLVTSKKILPGGLRVQSVISWTTTMMDLVTLGQASVVMRCRGYSRNAKIYCRRKYSECCERNALPARNAPLLRWGRTLDVRGLRMLIPRGFVPDKRYAT